MPKLDFDVGRSLELPFIDARLVFWRLRAKAPLYPTLGKSLSEMSYDIQNMTGGSSDI